ncbi:MAG: hypothetical protein K6U80_19465 [Firmicutes bacterium]|nr:hypothetical protein [Bacillota bacterium]
MHTLFEILHVLAAVTWIGGMIYSAFGIAPALKTLGSTKAEATNMMIMNKFSLLTWTSLILLILTGIYFIVDEGEKLNDQRYSQGRQASPGTGRFGIENRLYGPAAAGNCRWPD